MISQFGCGKNQGNTTSDNTIKFWHFWSEPSQKQALQQMINEFEKANNCKVELTELSWNDGKTKLLAAFNSNTAPDVLELGSDWIGQFSSSGVLKQMDNKFVNASTFLPWSIEPTLWKGISYAAPWVVDTRVLYVNKSLLENAGISTIPSTMEDVLAMSEKVHSDNVSGCGVNVADAHKVYKRILPLFWSNGGDVFDSTGSCVIAQPQNIRALNLYIDLSRSGNLNTQKELDALFAQGKLAFWYSGGWLAEKIGKENPLLEYAVIPLPGIGQNKGISFAGGEYLAINNATQKEELAKKFIEFITNGKTALEFCKQVTEAGFPASLSTYNDNYFASNQIKSVFATQLKSAKMTYTHPRWLEVEEVIENAVAEALYGRQTAEEALNNAAYRINKINANLIAKR